MALPRPTPSMIVSCTALAVALGGTGYAAITLPKNSVGTPQLKSSAVTGAKVRDGSLRAADFASGQLPRGEAGAKGDTGPKGDTGATGATGPTGPSAVFTSRAGSTVTVPATATFASYRSLTLAAGSYVIQTGGEAYYDATGSSKYECRINWTGLASPTTVGGLVSSTSSTLPVAITTTATFSASTVVNLECRAALGSTTGSVGLIYHSLTAIQTGSVTAS